jgi:hypothetical protein
MERRGPQVTDAQIEAFERSRSVIGFPTTTGNFFST